MCICSCETGQQNLTADILLLKPDTVTGRKRMQLIMVDIPEVYGLCFPTLHILSYSFWYSLWVKYLRQTYLRYSNGHRTRTRCVRDSDTVSAEQRWPLNIFSFIWRYVQILIGYWYVVFNEGHMFAAHWLEIHRLPQFYSSLKNCIGWVRLT